MIYVFFIRNNNKKHILESRSKLGFQIFRHKKGIQE